jgi:serine/threonine-protein kinase
MTKRTSSCGFLLLAGVFVANSPAWADPSPSDKATSDVLFKAAKKLVEEGHFNEACPKFEESQRLDPTPGTLLNLGDCYKGASPPRNASAWGAYRQAEVMAHQRGDSARQEGAALRAQAVEPLLTKVTIAVPSAARVPGFQLKWDGKSIGEGLWGIAIPVDAGQHAIEAEAPGKKRWTANVIVRQDAGTSPVDVPALAPLAIEPVLAAPVADRPYWGTQRIVGVGLGAAGLTGVVLGTIFGVQTLTRAAQADEHCLQSDPSQCDQAGVNLRHSEKASGTASTVSFIIGGAAVAAGLVLFLTAPPKRADHQHDALLIELAPAPAGATLRVRW